MTYQIVQWDGKPISAPGLYAGVTMDAYHGSLCVGPSLSKSGGWTIFDRSPKHYFATSYLNPDREEVGEAEALVKGRGAHHLLLGQEGFLKEFALRPDTYPDPDGKPKPWNGNATYCKAWAAEAKAAGKTMIKGEIIADIKGMATSLHEHPLVASGILNGLVEHSLVYRDRATGVWIKVRPDTIPTDSGDVADLKTIADISDEGIAKAIGGLGYNMQGAMIGNAMREVLGVRMNSFTLVFVESKAPYCVRVKTLIQDDLDLGAEQADLATRLFARCVERGEWHGPGGVQQDAEYAQMQEFRRKAIQWRISQLKQEMSIA